MTATKIATCSYCGTRAALVFGQKGRHELSCASCGAPLHELKMLRADHGPGGAAAMAGLPRRERPVKPTRRRPRKGRKSLRRRLFGELLDALDDLEDLFD